MNLAYDNRKMQYNFQNAQTGGFRVGAYCRLSREDKDKRGSVSESIENQRELILQYISDNNLTLVDVYEDDDFTGQNFQRDGFERLLSDLESGRINMVITKDLSRLGRDHIETGFYIEKFFPLNKIRYVAITDHVDSFAESMDNDMTPFKLMMNDFYSKDISKKVRASLDTKRRNGVYIGGFPPYGYKLETKGTFIIDEPAAAIVRRIFEEYCEGGTYTSIAKALTEEKVMTPAQYKQHTSTYKCRHQLTGVWPPESVRKILTNKSYIGYMVQGKFKKINYKVEKLEVMKKDRWIEVPDIHEPIVTKEVFDMAQVLVGRNNVKYTKRPKPEQPYQHILAGLMFCGECGTRMTFNRLKSADPFQVICYGHKKKICPVGRYFIPEAEIEAFVLEELKRLFNKNIDKDELLESTRDGNVKVELEGLNRQEKALSKNLEQAQNAFRSLYRDKMLGKVTERDYDLLYEDFTKNRDAIEGQLESLMRRKTELMKYQEDGREILAAIDDFMASGILTKTNTHKLINRIETFANKDIVLYANFSCE